MMDERDLERRLPCGADLAALVDQVAERLPAPDPHHQDACPHCRATVAELAELWAGVHALASQEIAAPECMVTRIIRRIRAAAARGAVRLPLDLLVPRLVRHALLPGPRGMTRIADSVVAGIAGRAARRIPYVYSAGAAVEVSGPQVTVGLRLVIEYGACMADVGDAVRKGIIRAVQTLTGLEVVAVNIDIDDVHLP